MQLRTAFGIGVALVALALVLPIGVGWILSTNVMTIDVVTAYCLCGECCEEWANQKIRVTSTGKDAYLVDGFAVDPTAIPYGTLLEIPGVGLRIADDTGGKMRQDWRKKRILHIDLRFANKENPEKAHKEALKWGIRRNMKVGIKRWGKEETDKT